VLFRSRATGEPGRLRELFTSVFAVEEDSVADRDGEKGVG
jgi:hypothetical protein